MSVATTPPTVLESVTMMIKVVRPDGLDRYLRGELTPGEWLGAPPFDHRVVGGTVVRQYDCARLRTPADYIGALGLGYPGSPFHADLAAVHVMVFPVVVPGQFTPVPVPGAVPTWWRRYAPVPGGATILEHTSQGTARPVARFLGTTLGWQDLR